MKSIGRMTLTLQLFSVYIVQEEVLEDKISIKIIINSTVPSQFRIEFCIFELINFFRVFFFQVLIKSICNLYKLNHVYLCIIFLCLSFSFSLFSFLSYSTKNYYYYYIINSNSNSIRFDSIQL